MTTERDGRQKKLQDAMDGALKLLNLMSSPLLRCVCSGAAQLGVPLIYTVTALPSGEVTAELECGKRPDVS